MIGWEAGDVKSRRCPEIRDQGRTVIDDVPCEQRVSVGEVVVDPDHTVVLINVPLVIGDQIPGPVPIVCSVRGRK